MMIASQAFSRNIVASLPMGGRNALDLPVAALAGLSVAIIAYAAPADALAELVAATGLPSIFASAEPPLGFKARMAIGVGGSLAAFFLAFAAMRLLDRVGRQSPPEPRLIVPDDSQAAPRLRRRDFHPDAPPRPPLMATLELGEPAPPGRPVWLQSADVEAGTEYMDDASPAPSFDLTSEEAIEHGLDLAEAEVEIARPEPRRAEPLARSLDDLMARLERGLERRRAAIAEPSLQPRTAPVEARAQDDLAPADDRLQNAIQSLQRFAARQRDSD